ncbi:MAG: hypothetical protein JSW25_07630 [Thermoplasmata archaeon]|nr:MAG: hypothetical protein JSW25_07630 [Thermoplasmata archaeon]
MILDIIRRRGLVISALVVTPIMLAFLAAGGLGVIGLGGYLVVFFLLVLWNFFAAWRAINNRRATFGGLLAPVNLAFASGYVMVFLVWGPGVIYMWGSDRALWALAYAVAATMTIYQLWRAPSTRRLRNHLFAVYNVVGTLAVAAWAMADVGSPGVWPLTVAAQSWGITQALLYMWGAYFAPIFFLPPLLVYEVAIYQDEEEDPQVSVDPDTGVVHIASEDSLAAAIGDGGAPDGPPAPVVITARRGPVRRVTSFAFDSLLGGLVVFLVVFSAVGTINLVSWNDLDDPSDAVYGSDPDFEFAAMGRAFTDRRFSVDGWREVVAAEIEHANELGLDYIRYDLHKEFIDDGFEMAKLNESIIDIRRAGMDVILSPFGSVRWEGDPPSFEELVAEIKRETYLLVETFEPAWVFPFFEPNGQVRVNLGGFAPVEDWVEVINQTGTRVRELSDHTLVLIEVAIEPEQGIALVEALSEPGLAIDAIGVDLYPLSAGDLDKLGPYREAATNEELEFWLGEFGVETVLSGHKGQARALSDVLVRASDGLDADGICVWALMDDTVLPSNLGLVARNGEEKEAYWVLQDAIDAIIG